MKFTRTISFIVLFLICLSGFCQSLKNSKRFYLKEKQVSILKRKTHWHGYFLFEKNKYLEIPIYSHDSISKSDIKNIKFSLFNSDYKCVQSHIISGHRDVFTTSERKKKRHVNIHKVKEETKPEIYRDYAVIKYPLRQKKITTSTSTSDSKCLSKGKYFLLVSYKHVTIDTITINVR